MTFGGESLSAWILQSIRSYFPELMTWCQREGREGGGGGGGGKLILANANLVYSVH